MTTIHIKGDNLESGLLKRLYNNFLKRDPLFHYVYWENASTHKAFIAGKNILIRVNDPEVLAELKDWLNQKNVYFEEYEYPHTKKKFQLGLSRKGWEAKHFDISQQLDHLCSVAALELTNKEWVNFVRQLLHIACNTKGLNFNTQTELLFSMTYGSYKVAVDQEKVLNKELLDEIKRRQTA